MVILRQPGDVDLVKTSSIDQEVQHSNGPRLFVVVGLLFVIALAVAAGFFFLRRTPSAPTQTVPAQKADAVTIDQKQVPLTPLPPLSETDTLVRELVGGLSSHPIVAAWLTTDGLVVNFVTVTNRIADGQSPARELRSIGPIAAFQARTSRRALSIDPSSYRRYDRYAQAVGALDAGGTARAYEMLKPRINEADRNFGGAGTFDAVLERAIVELLKVPVVDGEVPLRFDGIGYAFADPQLEGMSAAQKQLFRMGPENVRIVQSKLREIAAMLQIPDSRLPRPAPVR